MTGYTPERNVSITVLEKNQLSSIHESTLELMENTGMKIEGEKARRVLRAGGCLTGKDNLTRIPSQLVNKALKSAPKEIVLYTRDGDPFITVNHENQVFFGTHADQLEILDPFTGKVRKFKKADIALMCKVAEALPNINFVLSVGLASDMPPKTQSQAAFIETVRNFSKPINFSTNDLQGLKDIIEIASAVAGSAERLRQKPFIFHYCEPIPPLTHPAESTDKLCICAEHSIPVVYMPYCMMGGTSAMSFAGTLVQCNAEVLTGLVISQLANKGTPFIYGAMPSILDMRTTIGSYGAPELHLLIAAASEMANHYGIPFYGTAGCTDAKFLDEQSVAEATFQIFSTLLSYANIIHDVGIMDHCNSVSPELVVLADEIIEGLKHYSRGVRVDNESLTLDLIKKVGPGGHFLNEEHTLANFKQIWYPNLFSRRMSQGSESEVRGRIRQRLLDIRDNHIPPRLDERAGRELQAWDTRFSGKAPV